jgi:hypothetical protein
MIGTKQRVMSSRGEPEPSWTWVAMIIWIMAPFVGLIFLNGLGGAAAVTSLQWILSLSVPDSHAAWMVISSATIGTVLCVSKNSVRKGLFSSFIVSAAGMLFLALLQF